MPSLPDRQPRSATLQRSPRARLLGVIRWFALVVIVSGGVLSSSRHVFADPVITVPTAAQQKVIDENKKKDEAAFTPEVPLPGVFEGKQDGDETLLAKYIRAVYIYFIWVVGVVAVVMVMYGGIRWVYAAGNPGQIKEARDIIDNAIVGIIIALSSVVLLNIINPKLTQLQLPGLTQVKKETACLKKTFTDFNVCKGDDFVPCGQIKDKTGKDPDTGKSFSYSCYGTLCKPQNNVKSICMFVDATDGYGTPTCVTSVGAQLNDDKCNVTGTSTIPVTSQETKQAFTFTGVIQVGSGGLGTEYIGNFCWSSHGAAVSTGFIVGKPKAQVLTPVADAVSGSPTSHSRLNGRGCPDTGQDARMSELLLP